MRKLLITAFLLLSVTAFPPKGLIIENESSRDFEVNLNEGKRLIEFSEGKSKWLSHDEILNLKRKGVSFFDITDGDLEAIAHLSVTKIKPPKEPQFKSTVESIITGISEKKLQAFLTHFTSFHTRYFRSSTGAQSSDWLFSQITEVISTLTEADPIRVHLRRFKHDWAQSSIIARIESIIPNANMSDPVLPVVIVGAHQDSINMWNPYARAPGADDDGSGTTTIFEAFRLLIESKFTPKRPIEFQFYSAEEGGLLGSQKIAAEYKRLNVDVAAMIQFDMTGYHPLSRSPEVIAIGTDNVDPDTTEFLRTLAKQYTFLGVKDTSCGYGCSDHASFKKAGYNSAFATEADIRDGSPHIHTGGDNLSTINFSHMKEFVKLAVAWAVEWSMDEP